MCLSLFYSNILIYDSNFLFFSSIISGTLIFDSAFCFRWPEAGLIKLSDSAFNQNKFSPFLPFKNASVDNASLNDFTSLFLLYSYAASW